MSNNEIREQIMSNNEIRDQIWNNVYGNISDSIFLGLHSAKYDNVTRNLYAQIWNIIYNKVHTNLINGELHRQTLKTAV